MVHLAFTHVDCLRKKGDIALIVDLFKEWLCLECACSLCVFVQSYKTPFSFLCQQLLPLAEIPLK